MSILNEIPGDYERAEALVNLLIDRATGAMPDDGDFMALRSYFLEHGDYAGKLPRWFQSTRSLNQFWQFIKNRYSTYAERREFLWGEFEGLLSACESNENISAENEISNVLTSFDALTVGRTWRHMVKRVEDDPEGAITAARTLLESVCKKILDRIGVEYDDARIELSDLYKQTAKELNMSPDQHCEPIFKQILGGCSGVVNGLGSLRNKLGDAHGKGQKIIRPHARHSRLAVNLAGATAQFLVETYRHGYGEAELGDRGNSE